MKPVPSVCGTITALPERALVVAVITVMAFVLPLASDTEPPLIDAVSVVDGFTPFSFTTAPSRLGVPLPDSNFTVTFDSRCLKLMLTADF